MQAFHSNVNYIRSLDGVRGMAIILVVFFHSPVPAFQFQFGWVGVNLFFILSGFLITRILINTKQQPLGIYLKNFYIRRVLRIFPLYFFYLLLAFAGLLLLNHLLLGRDEIINQGISDFKRNTAFLVTYTYNFEGVINFLNGMDYHNSMFTGHLWSLSVEEQFYLIFPFIIYFLSKSGLKKLFLFIIFFIPFLRLLFVLVLKARVNDLFWIGDVLYVATPFQLDTLCMGACLVLFDFKTIIKKAPVYLAGLIIVMAITGIIHLQALKSYGMDIQWSSLGYDNPVYHLITQTPNEILNNRYFYSLPLINGAFALLMLIVLNAKKLNFFFENELLVYIGKVSYGIYIYHLALSYFFVMLTRFFIPDLGILPVYLQVILMGAYLAILFLVAGASYKYFEARFLYLKSRFSSQKA